MDEEGFGFVFAVCATIVFIIAGGFLVAVTIVEIIHRAGSA